MCIISMPPSRMRGAVKVLEAHHRPGSAFDDAVSLLDDVVQIL